MIAALAVTLLSTAALVEPARDDAVRKMPEAIRRQCPQATVETTEAGFVAKQGTMAYTMHSVFRTGEVSAKTFQREGPNFEGFMLSVTLHEGRYEGPADVAQTLQGPYFPTFIDAVTTEDGRKYLWISFSYGSRLDPKIKEAIFDILPGRVATDAMPGKSHGGVAQVKPADNAATKPASLQTGVVPIGSLGHPLGTYLTLEGRRLEGVKWANMLKIEKINGVALAQPLSIWVDNVELPADRPCVLKGYESARMTGAPRAYVLAMEEMGKDALMPQAGWQVQCFFVALRVLAPEDLQIKK